MRLVAAVLLSLCVLLAGGAGNASATLATVGTNGPVASDSFPVDTPAERSGGLASSDPETFRELQQEFDRMEFQITVHDDGSAEWTFRFQRTLTNETERNDFHAYADQFNENSTDLYADFQRRARTLTAEGANVTGRPMNATGFEKRAFVNTLGNQGVVELTFRWTAFAPVTDDGTVTVGDVFEGGLYIRSDQRLVVRRGPGLGFDSASPSPDSISGNSLADSDSITWAGERSFTDERPRIVLVPPATDSSTETGSSGGASAGQGTPTVSGGSPSVAGTTPGSTGGDGLGLLPLVGLGAVLLLGLGAAVAYRSGAFGGARATIDDDDGDLPGAVSASSEATATPEPAIPDEELLSDEDRVMGLLDDRGGRMKQVDIVEETGWSKSKVSMLLSDMEEEELISKLRVGRENIISKKGMEPEAARSPFDDED